MDSLLWFCKDGAINIIAFYKTSIALLCNMQSLRVTGQNQEKEKYSDYCSEYLSVEKTFGRKVFLTLLIQLKQKKQNTFRFDVSETVSAA